MFYVIQARQEPSCLLSSTTLGLIYIKMYTGATCAFTKRNIKGNYGLLPEKKAESEFWEILFIDLIGPYSIPTKRKDIRKKPEC